MKNIHKSANILVTALVVSLQTDVFGGAACVAYSFSANASNASLMLIDMDQLDQWFDITARHPTPNYYAACRQGGCSRTISLNSASGQYFFRISNSGQVPAWGSIHFQLFSAGASGGILTF